MSEKNMSDHEACKACEAKRGFFTLYDCGKPATKTCSLCQRSLCGEHFPKQLNCCIECEAESLDNIAFTTLDDEPEILPEQARPLHNLVAAYRSRREYLIKEKGKSIYLGQNLHQYYTPFDLRSFDTELSQVEELADSPDEVFFDS